MAPLVALAAGGAVLGAAGSIYEGQAAAAAGEYNARMLKINATQIRQQVAQEDRKLRIAARKQFGDMRASYGASGVTMEGSPLDVMEESARTAKIDSINLKYGGEVQARMKEYEAKLARFQGKSAKTASYFGAGSALASGGAKAYEYSQY